MIAFRKVAKYTHPSHNQDPIKGMTDLDSRRCQRVGEILLGIVPLIVVLLAPTVTIIGVFDHLKYTSDMKCTEQNITTRNDKPKNNLKNCSIIFDSPSNRNMIYFRYKFHSDYRSKYVNRVSPMYFNPCIVVFLRKSFNTPCLHQKLYLFSHFFDWFEIFRTKFVI